MEITQLKGATTASRIQQIDLSTDQTQLRKEISEIVMGLNENIECSKERQSDRKHAYKMQKYMTFSENI